MVAEFSLIYFDCYAHECSLSKLPRSIGYKSQKEKGKKWIPYSYWSVQAYTLLPSLLLAILAKLFKCIQKIEQMFNCKGENKAM